MTAESLTRREVLTILKDVMRRVLAEPPTTVVPVVPREPVLTHRSDVSIVEGHAGHDWRATVRVVLAFDIARRTVEMVRRPGLRGRGQHKCDGACHDCSESFHVRLLSWSRALERHL